MTRLDREPANGVRSIFATCDCGRRAAVVVSELPDAIEVPALARAREGSKKDVNQSRRQRGAHEMRRLGHRNGRRGDHCEKGHIGNELAHYRLLALAPTTRFPFVPPP